MAKTDFTELSLSQLAELVRAHTLTVRRRCGNAGVKPCRGDGRATFYRSHEALKAYYTLGGKERLDPRAERARLDRARAELLEHQLAARRAEFLPAGEIEWALRALIEGIRARLLAIPAAVAVDLAAEADVAARQRAVAEAIHGALAELANLRVVDLADQATA